jgi:hypothetical protein
MRAAPAGLLIKALLVPLDAFPTKKMLPAVGSDEFDHVIGDPIATLATFDCLLF